MYGLVFDVDGVIADTEGLIAEAAIRMFRELYGLEFAVEEFRPFIGTGHLRFLQGPAEARGLAIDPEAALASCHRHFDALLTSGRDLAMPGVLALMNAAFADPDWMVGIATSSPGDKSRATLDAARVPADRLDAWIHGDCITHKKPHPEIYQRAAAALGLDPAQCVAIEDAVQGIASARAAGLKCVAVTNSFPAEQLAAADLTVNSLEEVTLDRLRALLNT